MLGAFSSARNIRNLDETNKICYIPTHEFLGNHGLSYEPKNPTNLQVCSLD